MSSTLRLALLASSGNAGGGRAAASAAAGAVAAQGPQQAAAAAAAAAAGASSSISTGGASSTSASAHTAQAVALTGSRPLSSAARHAHDLSAPAWSLAAAARLPADEARRLLDAAPHLAATLREVNSEQLEQRLRSNLQALGACSVLQQQVEGDAFLRSLLALAPPTAVAQLAERGGGGGGRGGREQQEQQQQQQQQKHAAAPRRRRVMQQQQQRQKHQEHEEQQHVPQLEQLAERLGAALRPARRHAVWAAAPAQGVPQQRQQQQQQQASAPAASPAWAAAAKLQREQLLELSDLLAQQPRAAAAATAAAQAHQPPLRPLSPSPSPSQPGGSSRRAAAAALARRRQEFAGVAASVAAALGLQPDEQLDPSAVPKRLLRSRPSVPAALAAAAAAGAGSQPSSPSAAAAAGGGGGGGSSSGTAQHHKQQQQQQQQSRAFATAAAGATVTVAGALEAALERTARSVSLASRPLLDAHAAAGLARELAALHAGDATRAVGALLARPAMLWAHVTPEPPAAKLALLRERLPALRDGGQLAALLRRAPALLSCGAGQLADTLALLLDRLALPPADAARLLARHPRLLTTPARRVAPSLGFLVGLGLKQAELCAMLLRCPRWALRPLRELTAQWAYVRRATKASPQDVALCPQLLSLPVAAVVGPRVLYARKRQVKLLLPSHAALLPALPEREWRQHRMVPLGFWLTASDARICRAVGLPADDYRRFKAAWARVDAAATAVAAQQQQQQQQGGINGAAAGAASAFGSLFDTVLATGGSSRRGGGAATDEEAEEDDDEVVVGGW